MLLLRNESPYKLDWGLVDDGVVDRTVKLCIKKYYETLRSKELLGKPTEKEWRILHKLRIMYHVSYHLNLTAEEKKKIFCFISECKIALPTPPT
jgi:hypothetical protein